MVYRTLINTDRPNQPITLAPVGRGHHLGKDGNLYTDLETITTALSIVKRNNGNNKVMNPYF